MSVHPYVFYGGNCAEAFQRYKEIFGGELSMSVLGNLGKYRPKRSLLRVN